MIRQTLAILSLGIVIACGSPQQKAFEKLQSQEKAFYSEYRSKTLSKDGAVPMINKYKAFLAEHPDFEENPEIMLRYADIHMGTKNYFFALEIYDQFEKKYPTHKKRAFVLFNKGYACELAYKDSKFSKHQEFALFLYQEFLDKYPKHKLAKAVEISIAEIKAIQPEIRK
ncbi:MAG: tetratricopeptide repeat protein [Flavobacteriales bacterium]